MMANQQQLSTLRVEVKVKDSRVHMGPCAWSEMLVLILLVSTPSLDPRGVPLRPLRFHQLVHRVLGPHQPGCMESRDRQHCGLPQV